MAQCLCVLALSLLACATVRADEGALVTEKVFLDLEVEGHVERVIIGLFGSTSPKTVRNFVGLADHEVSESLLSVSFQCCSFLIVCVCVYRKDLATETPYSTESFPTS